MYRMLLALALAFAIRENIRQLLTVEGGLRAFELVHWVLVGLTLVMLPLCVFSFISGWKESKEKKQAEAEEEAAREAELTSEKYSELLEGEEAPEDAEESAPEETGAGKYDS